MSFNLEQCCRLCAKENPVVTLVSLLEKPVTVKKIEKMFSLTLFDLPDMPTKICKSCCRRLRDCFSFYATIFTADQLLRLKINNAPVVQLDKSLSENLAKDRAFQDELCMVHEDVDVTEFTCPHCLDHFESKGSLRGHVQNVHPNEAFVRKYRCKVCTEEFLTKDSREQHEATHCGETPYLCEKCGKQFAHSNNLIKHLSTHAAVRKKYPCHLCPKFFLTRTFLTEHQNLHYGNAPFRCEKCYKSFHGRAHLRQHHWTHAERTFSCAFCQKSFKRKSNMAAHVRVCRLKGQLENQALVKGAGMSPAIVNENEISTSGDDKVKSWKYLTCKRCRITFDNVDERKAHNAACHSDLAQCQICAKQFKHHGSLTYHRRVAHTGDRPYKCLYCEERFLILSAKTVHERKAHTRERPFSCRVCGSAFFRVSDLRAHAITHANARNFSCEVCGKLFKKKGSLTVHLKGHQMVKEYKCGHCEKDFVQKRDWLKHEKIHKPDNLPFFCKFCGDSFAKKSDAVKHALCRRKALNTPDFDDLGAAEKILDLVVQEHIGE